MTDRDDYPASWQWGEPNRPKYVDVYDSTGHMKPEFLVHQKALENGKISIDEYTKKMCVTE